MIFSIENTFMKKAYILRLRLFPWKKWRKKHRGIKRKFFREIEEKTLKPGKSGFSSMVL
jgi:hypothetical protein